VFNTTQEHDVIAHLMKFNSVVQEAVEQYKPSFLTSYLYDLGRYYNSFYAECPVGSSPEPVRSSRLILSKAVAMTLKQGLALLGIEAPERM
jgi:arginyl-tRNA synthetase